MERGDIVLDPLEGHALVLSSPVPGRVVFGTRAERVGAQPSEDVETILDRHDDDVGEVAQRAAVELSVVRAAVCVPATVDEDEDGVGQGLLLALLLGRSPHVQVEAVLGDVLHHRAPRRRVELHAVRRELLGLPDVLPRSDRRRRRPAARLDRRLRERHAQERVDLELPRRAVAQIDAFDGARAVRQLNSHRLAPAAARRRAER